MKNSSEITEKEILAPQLKFMTTLTAEEKRNLFMKTKSTNAEQIQAIKERPPLRALKRNSSCFLIDDSKVAQKELAAEEDLTPTNMLKKIRKKHKEKLEKFGGDTGKTDKPRMIMEEEMKIQEHFKINFEPRKISEPNQLTLDTEEMKDPTQEDEINPTIIPINRPSIVTSTEENEEPDSNRNEKNDLHKGLAKLSPIMKRITGNAARKLIRERHRNEIREAFGIKTFVILPDDPFKIIWSSFMLCLLIYATTVTPYRVAFVDNETTTWIIIDSIVDFFFFCDLVLNFFFAYYDEDEELIFDRIKIAKRYLKTWFIIDLIAIIPFNFIYERDYSSLSRLARLPRLYRLLKITKILKSVRVCREKNAWMDFAPEMSVAGERLIAFVIIVMVLVHVTGCLWYLLAKIEGIYPDSWVVRYGYQNSSNFVIYSAAIYFTVTTITTVGYGDISAQTDYEQWFCVLTMVIGVMSYSFCISSLSSILTSYDIKETNKNKALQSLHRIDIECKLDTKIYLKIKKAIIKKFKEVEYIKNRDHLMTLLPRKLRGDLNAAMHTNLVRKVNIFKEESVIFVDYLARLLKPVKYQADTIICQEGALIDEIYFIIKGSVEYVLPQYNDTPYWKISKGERFGDLEILRWFTGGRTDTERRLFTAKAKEDCEILVLSKTDLFLLYKKYQMQTRNIFEGSDLRLQHTRNLKEQEEKKHFQRHHDMNKFIKKMSIGVSSTPGLKTGYTRRFSDSIQSEESSFGDTSSFTSSDLQSTGKHSLNDSKVHSNLSDITPKSGTFGKIAAEKFANMGKNKELYQTGANLSGNLSNRLIRKLTRKRTHRGSKEANIYKPGVEPVGRRNAIGIGIGGVSEEIRKQAVQGQRRKGFLSASTHLTQSTPSSQYLHSKKDIFGQDIIEEEKTENELSPTHRDDNRRRSSIYDQPIPIITITQPHSNEIFRAEEDPETNKGDGT